MARLYELSSQYQQVIEMTNEDGELTPEALDLLDKTELSIKEKGQNLAIILNNMDSNVDILDNEIARLTKMKKSIKANQDRLKNYLSFNLEKMWIEKLDTDLFKIGFRKSESVIIADDVVLPEEFVKITVAPDKTELKKAIKAWKTIEWVSIVENKNLYIK